MQKYCCVQHNNHKQDTIFLSFWCDGGAIIAGVRGIQMHELLGSRLKVIYVRTHIDMY